MLVPCTLTVVEERPKAAAVQVIQDGQQEALIELKGCRKLVEEKKQRKNRFSVISVQQKY